VTFKLGNKVGHLVTTISETVYNSDYFSNIYQINLHIFHPQETILLVTEVKEPNAKSAPANINPAKKKSAPANNTNPAVKNKIRFSQQHQIKPKLCNSCLKLF
jgi:hypothetical protein